MASVREQHGDAGGKRRAAVHQWDEFVATITEVQALNFLSLQNMKLQLKPLNVLVGPNGAGKTNLLKLFQFLGEVARSDLVPAIDAFGGIENLRFRGEGSKSRVVSVGISGVVTKYASANTPDEYSLRFWDQGILQGRDKRPMRFIQRSERIVLKRTAGRGRRIELAGGSVDIADTRPGEAAASGERVAVQPSSSGLAILRRLGKQYDADQVEALAEIFEELRLFEVDVDAVRRPSTGEEPWWLRPDGSNLAAFLLWMKDSAPDEFERLCSDVRYVLPGFKEFVFTELGGGGDSVRVDIRERNLRGLTPLSRASFGTIRSIALFAMLHDPNPPKLTCLEEVDHGLHPYALDRLVDRLREASTKTQIIVATHSPALVNRLRIEDLVVFERDETTGGTRIVDLKPDVVRKMQEESGYGLGELWFSGTLGGVPQ